MKEKKWKLCFCFFTGGKKHKVCKLDMITCDIECHWHDNWMICSYDVTDGDFGGDGAGGEGVGGGGEWECGVVDE